MKKYVLESMKENMFAAQVHWACDVSHMTHTVYALLRVCAVAQLMKDTNMQYETKYAGHKLDV